MKNLIIFLLLTLTTNAFAQIKEQFTASNDAKTTVVIKEGRASDKDILAQNFDLDDYRVGDVIRITTTKEVTEKASGNSSGVASSTSSHRVKRKKKRSFALFKRPKRGKKRTKKANYLKCYNF